MELFYGVYFSSIWVAWLIYWVVRSRDVKSTARRESFGSRLSYIAPIILAAILLFPSKFPIAALNTRFLPIGEWEAWAAIGAALALGGLAFTVWARVHLGRNWSGTVTVKEDHELITTGPYGWVRHPIYSGLLVAFIGQAIARSEIRGLIAAALVFISFWWKSRIEERWMAEQFGARYRAYSQHTAALIPYLF
jgi:protein-S-isoprenylcysteine O-methyltransferase Ste14